MTDLHEKNCIPCRGGVPAFDISEIHKYLKKVDGWDVKKKENEIYFLEKNFRLICFNFPAIYHFKIFVYFSYIKS